MTEEENRKPGRPAQTEVYCLSGNVKTSKGRIFHGDRIKLPKEEAQRLINQGWVE